MLPFLSISQYQFLEYSSRDKVNTVDLTWWTCDDSFLAEHKSSKLQNPGKTIKKKKRILCEWSLYH